MDVESIGTSEGKPTSRWPADQQARWLTACELLKAGQYARAAELLHELQAAAKHTGQAGLANILAAAHQICLACDRCQAEVEWHGRACQEAEQREQELQQQLHDILDLVIGRGALETEGKRLALPTAPTTDLSSPEHNPPQREERAGLWQRIQSRLRWGPSPQPPEQDAPVVSAQAPTLSAIEETGARAPPTAEGTDALLRPTAEAVQVPALPPDKKVEIPAAPPNDDEKQKEPGPPSLAVYCLGPFRVYQDNQPVKDWPSSKGKCIFKYLVTHRKRPVAKEVLMELFWPGAHPDAARNNLNVAIYGLRQALREARPSVSHVLFQDDCYLLNPDLQIWVDVEEFVERFRTAQNLERRGDLVAAIREYGAAEALYQGEFLEEDRYEDWLIPQRQGLHDDYLSLLDRLSRYYFHQKDYGTCRTVCGEMLAVDACREEAHRRLMRCYSRQGQPYLALRQYHLCVETLQEELDVPPMEETLALYQRIRAGEAV